MQLDKIIVPGGGQQDLWQSLNCKGRYAGELRIELTYYDTRPRENLQGQQQGMEARTTADDGRERLSGPRQPNPPKRRPLPSEPNSAEHSSPISIGHGNYHHPGTSTQHGDDQSRFRHQQTTAHPQSLAESQAGPPRGYMPEQYVMQNDGREDDLPQLQDSRAARRSRYSAFEPDLQSYEPEQHPAINQSPVDEPPFGANPDYATSAAPFTSFHQDQVAHPSQFAHPDNIDLRLRSQPVRQNTGQSSLSQYAGDESLYSVSPMSKNNSYDNSLAHQNHGRFAAEHWASPTVSPVEDFDAPPPPPTHGYSEQREQPLYSPHGSHPFDQSSNSGSIHSWHSRASPSGSLQSTKQMANPYQNVRQPPVPSNASIALACPSASPSQSTAPQQPRTSRARSPVRDYRASMPSSLVPGYERDNLMDPREDSHHERQRKSDSQFYQEETNFQAAMPARSLPPSNPHVSSSPFSGTNERRPHRYSVPVVKPVPVPPQNRAVPRKSVSPQPEMASTERQQSAIPFSPDSYDTLNPSISQSTSVNDLGARYDSPEQAREASRQAERQAKLGDGPIIGSNGRVIDPSDHLPTDTWAPEPEPKQPRKGPEVAIRFRHSPHGAQPMHPSRLGGTELDRRQPLTETRPNMVPQRGYQHNSADASPASAHRTRLQKKVGLMSPQHTASSPAVPTVHSTPSPRYGMSRSANSDYASHMADSNENSPYGNSPTRYRNRSPVRPGVAPPVPGKISIDTNGLDTGMSALSDEMSRIDIGAGSGPRPRRARFGA